MMSTNHDRELKNEDGDGRHAHDEQDVPSIPHRIFHGRRRERSTGGCGRAHSLRTRRAGKRPGADRRLRLRFRLRMIGIRQMNFLQLTTVWEWDPFFPKYEAKA